MKATRIKIEPGESVEVSISRPGTVTRYYSSVGTGAAEDPRCPEPREHTVGFDAVMKICGPALLCIVKQDKA